jgi:hypothetical protein
MSATANGQLDRTTVRDELDRLRTDLLNGLNARRADDCMVIGHFLAKLALARSAIDPADLARLKEGADKLNCLAEAVAGLRTDQASQAAELKTGLGEARTVLAEMGRRFDEVLAEVRKSDAAAVAREMSLVARLDTLREKLDGVTAAVNALKTSQEGYRAEVTDQVGRATEKLAAELKQNTQALKRLARTTR